MSLLCRFGKPANRFGITLWDLISRRVAGTQCEFGCSVALLSQASQIIQSARFGPRFHPRSFSDLSGRYLLRCSRVIPSALDCWSQQESQDQGYRQQN